mmetsp:Transcript_4853/g.10781  ORF Transcript_4853/g.10781 Transcript_4853/m.10781 type:complete len:354 (+) Transcript_4853:641-1702(+)
MRPLRHERARQRRRLEVLDLLEEARLRLRPPLLQHERRPSDGLAQVERAHRAEALERLEEAGGQPFEVLAQQLALHVVARALLPQLPQQPIVRPEEAVRLRRPRRHALAVHFGAGAHAEDRRERLERVAQRRRAARRRRTHRLLRQDEQRLPRGGRASEHGVGGAEDDSGAGRRAEAAVAVPLRRVDREVRPEVAHEGERGDERGEGKHKLRRLLGAGREHHDALAAEDQLPQRPHEAAEPTQRVDVAPLRDVHLLRPEEGARDGARRPAACPHQLQRELLPQQWQRHRGEREHRVCRARGGPARQLRVRLAQDGATARPGVLLREVGVGDAGDGQAEEAEERERREQDDSHL